MKNRRALVTGSEGLIGSQMVRELEQLDFEVYTLDMKSDGKSLGDILKNVSAHFDIVAHCAQVKGNRAEREGEPERMIHNLKTDADFFRWAIESRQSNVIYFSSPEVYGKVTRSRPIEEGEWNCLGEYPYSDYGWAKLTGERMAYGAIRSGIRVTVLRPFSVYSFDESYDTAWTRIMRMIGDETQPIVLHDKGMQIRDWTHVTDVTRAAMAIFAADVTYPVNICSGRSIKTKALIEIACRYIGRLPQYREEPRMPSCPIVLLGDNHLMLEHYQPKVTIERAIERTFRWRARTSARP